MITPALLLAAGLAGAASSSAAPDPKALASFAFDASRPAQERIADIPGWLLERWRAIDEAPDYRSYAPTAADRAAWAQTVAGLPPRLRRALDERLIAAYFVSGLKGNGITDWTLDASSRVYVYMILNPTAFRRTLSETLTERDRSVFTGEAAVAVDAGPGGSGMLYAVAHESAHAFDYVSGLTPFTDPGAAAALSRSTTTAWDVWASYRQPRTEEEFPARTRLRFYGFQPPELEAAQAPDVYAQLARSPFVSLYGSANWADDAAELFVFRHLTGTLGRPYRILVGPPGRRAVIERWGDPRVRERAARVLAPLYD